MNANEFARRIRLLNVAPPKKVTERPETFGPRCHAMREMILAEIAQRERAETLKFYRGWESYPLARSQKGLPVRLLIGRKSIARIVIDPAGQVRTMRGKDYDPGVLTLSEIIRKIV